MQRLIGLAKSLPVKDVPLFSIRELDESFWFGGRSPTCCEMALHAKLTEETELKHPIVMSDGGRVMDGLHRVCKALLESKETVSAVQFIETPAPDYIDADAKMPPYDEPHGVDGVA